MSRYDAVVIGAGHNGLAAATLLADAGLSVLVLERCGAVGGIAASQTIAEGFRTTGIWHDTATLRPWVVRLLKLRQHGLQLRPSPPLLASEVDGPGLMLDTDPGTASRNVAARNPADGKGYRHVMAMVDRFRPAVHRLMEQAAPNLGAEASVWPLIKAAASVRRLGNHDMLELLHIAPLPLETWLAEHIETPLVRAVLAGRAMVGSRLGPLSPQGAAHLILGLAGEGQLEAAGGPAAVVAALEAAATSRGVTVRTDAEVKRIDIDNGRVAGVTLDGGDTIETRWVLAAVAPQVALLDLVDPAELPASTEEEITRVRARGSVAKLDLAVRGLPRARCQPGRDTERVWIGQHPLDLERAWDDVKHRRLPSAPPLDVRIPSLADPTLAPPDHHVVSVLVHCAAHDLDGGWTDAASKQLEETVVAQLDRHFEGIDDVVAQALTTPADLEGRLRLPGGHPFHLEHALDQLWAMRPTAALSQHTTPIRGLLLGSSGTHPGGGITGAPGVLGATAALEQMATQGGR